jgi:hypothetical protein
VNDTADHAAVVHSFFSADILRQVRLDLSPLFVVQPKQVAPHPLPCSESPQKANQQPIQLATDLLGFDPRLALACSRSFNM